MTPLWGYGAYFATFALLALLRAPFMARSVRTAVKERRASLLDHAAQAMIGLGALWLPVMAALGLLHGANQPLQAWRLPLGVAGLALAAVLFYRAHADLGTNWSPTLTVRKEHTIVTTGVYARVRHPMYSSFLVLALAQALLVPNWIGGLSGLAGLALFLLARVGREERMMEETFGEQYRLYARRTGRLWPRLHPRA
jgi:protein-S-isoprenylcysteine O-methyltransferase Ste14